MGTPLEWALVAFYCLFFGGWMLAWETRKRKKANVKPNFLPASAVVWFFSGLTFGLLMTFRLRASHSPLVFLTVGSFVFAAVAIALTAQERNKPFKQVHGWEKTASFFLLMTALLLLLIHQLIPLACLLGIAAGVLSWLAYLKSKEAAT